MKKFNLTILLSLLSIFSVVAQEATTEKGTEPKPSSILDFSLSHSDIFVLLLLALITVLLFAVMALLKSFKILYQEQINPTPYKPAEKPVALDYDIWIKEQKKKPSVWDKVLSLKPLEQEKDLVIEHEYDGIKELNNGVPAWFNTLFYTTIIIGICYLIYYHGGYGQLQDEEYTTEMTKAEVEKTAYLAKAANAIDENSVKLDNAIAIIASGKAIFAQNCVACHGDKAQGTVGPNLTDEYWLHGGGIHNVFKTIKYGVLEKGMVSWEKTLTPKQISEVANFILSLKGTNPPSPKAPQGEKYVEEKSTTSSTTKDSVATK